MSTYRVHERGQYEPPACPGCHQRHHVDWLDFTQLGDPEPKYIPGRDYCRTPGCVYNDLEQAR